MKPASIRVLSILPATLCLMALGGCGKGAEQPAGKAAGAQVLPGTISDSMLDLDRSQAQAPLQPSKATRTTASDILGDDASTGAADSDAAPDAAKPATGPAAKPEKPAG